MKTLTRTSLAVLIWLSLLATGFAVGEGRYVGGSFDGFVYTHLMQSSSTPMDSRYRGGSFDGVNQSTRIQNSFSAPDLRFSGGSFDGVDSAALLQNSFPAPDLRFFGGSFDGKGHSWQIQNLQADSTLRYAGGSFDGFDPGLLLDQPNPLNRDTDSDTLPDWWELLYYDGLTNAVATADTDFDTFNAREEYQALTDPTSDLSYFAITDVVRSNDQIRVTLLCSEQRVYDLMSNTNLLVEEWTPVSGFTNMTGDPSGILTLDLPLAEPIILYRTHVRIPQ